MVETKTLLNAGRKSGAIKDDWVMVGLPQGYRLIAAPPATSSLSYALIFWEPKDDNDRNPAFDKMVSTHLVPFSNSLMIHRLGHVSMVRISVIHHLQTHTPSTFGCSAQHLLTALSDFTSNRIKT